MGSVGTSLYRAPNDCSFKLFAGCIEGVIGWVICHARACLGKLSFLGAFPERSLVNVFWWSSWSYISDFLLCSWSLSEKNNILRCGFSLQQLHGIICIPTNAFILIS